MTSAPPATRATRPSSPGPIAWVRAQLSLPGLWGALVLACLSLTPSLLPRNGVTQGLVTGISAAIGYGLGILVAYVWRAFADRPPRTPDDRAWRALAVAAGVGIVLALLLGRAWQSRLRLLMGTDRDAVWLTLLTPVVAVFVFVLLFAASRGVRRLYRNVTSLLSRRIGARAATVVGWFVVAVGGYLLVTGLLADGFVALADRTFSVRDGSTADDVAAPPDARRSGSPESLVAWDSLGRQGRSFAAGGPTAAEIASFSGGDAEQPIRTYAGIATAEDVEQRAQMAVDDLQRAGGFDRDHLLVATTTGTGWLDPGAIASFEYLSGGDSAIVAMQYSYLPSWLSYLVDQVRARQAGRELFDAVYERWVALPEDDRPELFVFGESLGSFGGEAAFSGEYDLRNRTAGALFVGPPGFNALHREFTEGRDDGSRQVEPVFRDGRTVRFSNEIGRGAAPSDRPWDGTRVLYLQHPSDPIVWWDTDLLLRRPDWLDEARGRDVLDQMVWIPFVTFWQVTVDMPLAVDVPDGHGHRYTSESVDAWAQILQVEDWDDDRAERLRALVLE